MAGIEDLKKQMSQIAADEYYAGLQSLFERDPLAKEMNVSKTVKEDASEVILDASCLKKLDPLK